MQPVSNTKRYAGLMFLCAVAVSTSACTRAISSHISAEGHVAKENLVFPSPDKAWQKDGHFANRENLSHIKAGIGKDDLYRLIGTPHFSEAQHAREWDYLLKFYEGDEVKTCQYKVIFDKNYKAQEFYWQPTDCDRFARLPTPNGMPMISERINLETDALFKFDGYEQKDILPAGRMRLDQLAEQLLAWEKRGDSRVHLVGHTDRYGSDEYNMLLSERRAETVRRYLIAHGINAATLTAAGAGSLQPLPEVVCDINAPRAEQIQCLQPNRRVEVDVAVYAHTKEALQEIRYQNLNNDH